METHAKTDQGAIQKLNEEKLALFVKMREVHLEITKINQKLMQAGADATMMQVCW
jgi:hypothetical protein